MTSLSISSSPTSVSFTGKFNLSQSSFHGVRIAQMCPSVLAVRTSSAGSSSFSSSRVVMMAKKQEELKEIRAKTTEELNEEIVDLKGELFMLRLQRSARNEFKSSEFRRMHKRVARILTIKREREIEEGVTTKRFSRKLDKKWKKSIVPRPPPSLKKLQEEEAAAEAKEAS